MLQPCRIERAARLMGVIAAACTAAYASASPAPASFSTATARIFDVHSVSEHGVVELAVDPTALAQARAGATLIVPDFPLSATDRRTLHLTPFRIFAPGAQVIHSDGDLQTSAPLPEVTLLRGTIDSDPNSCVYLAIADKEINGFLQQDGKRLLVSTAKDPAALPVVFDPSQLPGAGQPISPPACGAESLPEYHAALANFTRPTTERTSTLPRRLVRVAIDTDAEFVALFPNHSACSSYVATLLGAVSSIYSRELNVDLQVSYIELRTSASDPWTENSASPQLSQFRLYWLAHRANVQRDVAHLLSHRAYNGAGGTAYLNGLCSDLAFGLSGYLYGSFPAPLESNNAQNWDAYVVTHEMGHNFGAPHTHQMSPPIDLCAIGNCSQAHDGTIMSYCHTCDGSLGNIAFNFHSRIINERIGPFLAGLPCTMQNSAACLADFDQSGYPGGADLSLLLNLFFSSTAGPFIGGDLNGDAYVNSRDLSVFLSAFGQPCN